MRRDLDLKKILHDYPLEIMGHKANERLLRPILSCLPDSTDTLLDLFGGTGAVSYVAKHLGIRTITNDIRRYAHLQHRVLLENNSTVLTERDLKILLADNRNRKNYAWKCYKEIFGKDNSTFVDNWASNISKLSNRMKQAIAVFVPIIPLLKQLDFPTVRFTAVHEIAGIRHFKHLNLREETLKYATETFPRLLHDNGQRNEVYQEDSIGLLGRVKTTVAYLDPPYSCNGGRYSSDYAFYEFMVLLLSGRVEEIIKPHGMDSNLGEYQDFANRTQALTGFGFLFDNARHIPLLIVSYNTKSLIEPTEIASIAEAYGRDVSIQEIAYEFPSTVKGRARESNEVLIVCRMEAGARGKSHE